MSYLLSIKGKEVVGKVNFTVNKNIPNTAQKSIFSFSKCSEKMTFPKKSDWNMIFLVPSGNMIFLFPENMILSFRRKMKDNLSQKKYMEI